MTSHYSNNKAIKGAILYLLIIVTLVQMVWPITFINQADDGTTDPFYSLLYQLLYMSLLIGGIIVARDNRLLNRLLTLLGIIWLGTGFLYTFNQTASWALIAGYLVISIFQILVTVILIRFIFSAPTINREVLLAACTIYLMLGAIFVPIYGLIESATFFQSGGLEGGVHAFSDGTIGSGEIFPWQTLIYYSYATLTTLGYGDILPVTPWARSAASLEAIVGVLYITVIMARLVGLYASAETEEFIEREQSKRKA